MALEEEQGPEGEGQGERERVRARRVGHGEQGGQPGGERQARRRPARGQPPRQQRHRGIGQHPDDPPVQQRWPGQLPEPGQEVGLSRRVVPPEVAVGHLAVGDPGRRLEHQPLVVGLDAPQHRQGADGDAGGEEHPGHDQLPAPVRERRGGGSGVGAHLGPAASSISGRSLIS